MMLISPASAKALTSIILRSTQGDERARSQLPWQVEDRADCWLVRGTPFNDNSRQLRDCQFSIFIQKTSAEVIGLRFDSRCELDGVNHARLKAELPEAAFDAMFGPVLDFEPEPANLGLCTALYGGLVNTPEDAIDFAHALAQDDATTASFVKSSYQASEASGTWHIVCRNAGNGGPIHLCDLSRTTGKVMSGILLQ